MSESTVPAGHAPPSSANDVEYFQLFNARNAKIISCVILAVAVFYHALLRLHYGEDTCIGLLEDGRYQGSHIWQPYGCMLHTYSRRNARMCMKYKRYWGQHNHLLFVGDQRTRQLFFAFLRRITAEEIMEKPKSYLPLSEDDENANLGSQLSYSFTDKELNLTLEFLWDPGLRSFIENDMNTFSSTSHHVVLPIIVAGSVTPAIQRKENEEGHRNYSRFAKIPTSPLVLHNGTQILWMLQGPVDEGKVQVTSSKSPVERPAFGSKWNEAINDYNYEMEHLLAGSKIKIWRSASLIMSEKTDSYDGVQMGKIAADYNAQIILNFCCNGHMNFPDGTCCRKGENRSNRQTCACAVYIFSILLTCVVAWMRRPRRPKRQGERNGLLSLFSASDEGTGNCCSAPPKNSTITLGDDPVLAALFAWSKLCALLLLIYATDRTNYFMNENKWFTMLNFFLPVGYFFVLGLFFTENTGKTGFMHKDQTNEWKGWMMLTLMVYNMTEASQVLWIYMLYRSLISGFLFLFGYSHFVYFWTTGDFTLRRFVTICLRYNFLALLLCLTMSRPYQFYHYVSLITFWFLVIYVTLAIPPRLTSTSADANAMHYFVMVVKFVILYSIISVLYLSEVFFEKIFLLRPWKALFVTPDGSIEEWWQRWWLDRYTAANGMACAFAVSILRRYLVLNDEQSCNLFGRRLFILSFVTAVCGFVFYGLTAVYCGNHLNCNEIHGYVSFVPVLSYLVLRNLFGGLRSRVSTFFAWFGRISLELFTAQPHLWLAADSHGILVLLPRWPVFNVIIISFLFVCFAHEMNIVIKQLIPLLICNDGKVLLRNLLILIAVGTVATLLYGITLSCSKEITLLFLNESQCVSMPRNVNSTEGRPIRFNRGS